MLGYIVSRAVSNLKYGTYSKNGRNFLGRICVFGRGGGFSRKYRLVDFHRRLNLFCYIYKILYDPNRTAYIGLAFYTNGLMSFIVLSDKLNVGNKIFSGTVPKNFDSLANGSSILFSFIPIFSLVNNIELFPKRGSSICRAAGTSALLVSKLSGVVSIKLKSGWLLNISDSCIASLGFVSNVLHNMRSIKKAGKNRGLGFRPGVRGVAMNPCDHPHGGGNGKSSPPRAPVTPWGKITKWSHTKNKKIDKLNRKLFKTLR